MSFAQLLKILWARRRLMMTVTAGAVLLALLAYLVMPKTYVSATSLVIDSRGVDPLTGAAPNQSMGASVLATQMDVIGSRAVALQVVDKLGLANDPDLKTKQERAAARESVARSLLMHLTLKPASTSNVIRIEFENGDPQMAANVANGFADAYQQTAVNLRLDPAKRQSAWFDEQLQSLRNLVEERRARLSEFQRANGITPVERLDVETARLDEISRQLVDAQRNSQAADARLQQAKQATQSGRLPEVPEILGNSLLQSLKADLVRAQGQLANASERYGRNHPQYIAASAEVQELQQKINVEVNRAKGSIDQASRIAQQQTNDLQRAFDDQKARILELTRQRDEMSVRDREVQNAQAAYDAALQRASQLRLESQLNQTTVAVLDRASAPVNPAGLGLVLTTALSLIFGSILGAALALTIEMLDRRVRDGEEILTAAGLEVLGEVPRLRASFKQLSAPPVRGVHAVLEGKPI